MRKNDFWIGLALGTFVGFLIISFVFVGRRNLFFDISVAILTIFALVIIGYVFLKKSKNTEEKTEPKDNREQTKGFYSFGIAFVIAAIAIALGAVMYSVKDENIPIRSVKIGNCEVCFCIKKTQEGKKLALCCDKQEISYVPYLSDLKMMFPQEFNKALEKIIPNNFFQLLCAESANAFIEKLDEITKFKLGKIKSEFRKSLKIDKIPENVKTEILEILILDRCCLETLKETINSCQCDCKCQCCGKNKSE